MTLTEKRVDILLATYNGARFLPEQLASLEDQTVSGWRLVVRDDGSSDDTAAILADFRRRHPAAVCLLEDSDGRLGPCGNFNRLLRSSNADFVFLCDQDDVWKCDKMAKLLEPALAHDNPNIPLLVHSDLEVVDEKLRLIAHSFWKYQYVRPERCDWRQLLVQNVVTGCAMVMNRALCSTALPISSDAVMHDWWLAIIAALEGKIRWIPDQTVQYRQHSRNDTGANPWNVVAATGRARRLFASGDYRRRIMRYRRQAAAVASRPSKIDEDTRVILRGLATLNERPFFCRVAFLLRHNILKTGFWRNLVWLICV